MKLSLLSKKRVLQRLAALESERDPHLSTWKNITNYIRPARGKYLYPGQEEARRPTSMVNSTPYIASRTLQAGMQSGASSPAYEWFELVLADPEISRWGPAQQALFQRKRILYDVLANSNFYQTLQTGYGDAADFGSTVWIMDPHPKDFLTMRALSPGEYFIDTDPNGDINCVYRKFNMTVLQLVTKFGDRVSAQVQLHYDRGNYNIPIVVIETIESNIEQIEGRRDWRGKPFVRLTFEYASQNQGNRDADFLAVSGYDDWPCPNLRWDIASGNKWGWGPGIVALGDSAALQTLEFRDAQAVETVVKPPLGAPSTMKNRPISQTPGGITFYDPMAAGANAKVEPLYTISPGVLNALDAKIQRAELRINEIYYKDLFLMLASSDRREITAREVEEKHQEKLLALGPTLQRTHRDALDLSIIRAYNLCERAGLFPEAPKEIQNMPLGIKYISTLAYAQRAAGAASLERFFGFLGQVSEAWPNLRHKVDEYEAFDEYADAIGVPAPVIRTTAKAQEAANAESQAKNTAQAAEVAQTGANAAKLLSETDTARPSALDFVRQRGGLQ